MIQKKSITLMNMLHYEEMIGIFLQLFFFPYMHLKVLLFAPFCSLNHSITSLYCFCQDITLFSCISHSFLTPSFASISIAPLQPCHHTQPVTACLYNKIFMSESCLYVRVFEAVRHVHFSYTDADAICGFICISILCMDALAHVPVSICFPEKEKKHKRVCVCARVFTGCSFMQEECALITGCRRLCCVHL